MTDDARAREVLAALRDPSGRELELATSGSTGAARPVRRSAASWAATLDPLTDVTVLGPDDVVWLPGPATSTLFLYGAVHAVHVGARTAWGAAAPEVTAAHLVPLQLADACDLADAGGLPALRLVVVAGAGLGAGLRERAVRHGWRVLEYYGAAELSFVGWSDDDGPMRAVPGAEVELRDVGTTGAGELWVRSPYIATSGPALRLDGRGWATVGDRAVSDGDGWRVLGRGDLAVQTGGHTVPVEEVERVLEPVAGTGHLAVVGLPHPRLGQRVTAVVVVGSRSDAELLPRLEGAARTLPAAHRPRAWLDALAA
ncbi:AMP-binding protein, partial [Angustibacter aerolatus]